MYNFNGTCTSNVGCENRISGILNYYIISVIDNFKDVLLVLYSCKYIMGRFNEQIYINEEWCTVYFEGYH